VVLAAPPPGKSLARLDEDFAAAADSIARRAEKAGASDFAALVRGWTIPAFDDRQVVVEIPPRLEKPEAVAGPETEALWQEFLAARKARAAGMFEHALVAAAAHDATPARGTKVDPDAPPGAARSCAVVELIHRTLRDDPDHARARAAAGYVRRDDSWVRPEAARRLDRGEQWDPAFGWQPRSRLARYRAGERPDRGRWITAAEDDARRLEVAAGRRFSSTHWDILSAAPLADVAALAAGLEETADVWRQVFGAMVMRPADWERALAHRAPPRPHEAFAAVLCADRRQYVAELEKVEPTVARTTAIYWRPTQTAWFCAAPGGTADEPAGVPSVTVHHEAAHQLCAEATDTSPLAGERCGFWAIEAAACHLESIHRTGFGWTVGGADAGRVPAARRLLVEDDFHVPLADLCGMSRAAFQADERLPHIYDELAGLADFFMNGHRGRYREAFIDYLARVYAGTADPDTLARLCRSSCAELDAEYRRHLSR